MTMTEVELSDALGVCVKLVAKRRLDLGLSVGVDLTDGENGVVYTAEGVRKIRAAFGLAAQDDPGCSGAFGDQGPVAEATPAQAGAQGLREACTLQTAPVVWVKVLRAKPNEAARNNRHFVVVVLDAKGVEMTDRVESLYAAHPEPGLRRGMVLQALDMPDGPVLDRAELRRRGVCLK